jgi:hypothetical protein
LIICRAEQEAIELEVVGIFLSFLCPGLKSIFYRLKKVLLSFFDLLLNLSKLLFYLRNLLWVELPLDRREQLCFHKSKQQSTRKPKTLHFIVY